MFGDVTTAGRIDLQDGVLVDGTRAVSTPVTATTEKLELTWPSITAPTVNLEPDKQGGTLAPGAYSGLVLKSRSEVTLTAGNYYFDDISTEPESRIRLDVALGPIVITVRNSATLKGQILGTEASYKRTLWVLLGAGTTYAETPLHGTWVAPNGRVELRCPNDNSAHRGAVFAKQIQISSDALLEQVGFDWGELLPLLRCRVLDSDKDGVNDCDDGCPSSALKSRPGVAGCRAPDSDRDGDGSPDVTDAFPDNKARTTVNSCSPPTGIAVASSGSLTSARAGRRPKGSVSSQAAS